MLDRSSSRSLFLVALFLLAAACSTLTDASRFQAGRRALLADDYESAVAYFASVAERRPNYVNVISNYRESVWTYLGRAQYGLKRYPEARRSLEKAVALEKNDSLARLYLGLTLLRMGELPLGAREVEVGMKGIYDWIEYMNRTQPFQAFWDPNRQIRKQIDQELAALSSKDFRRESLLNDAEWIGKTFEEELERVRQDERRQFERDIGDDNGRGQGGRGAASPRGLHRGT